MTIDGVSIIGFVATVLILFSQVPQIYKSLKTKSTGDLSLWMILLLISGVALWLIYGILRPDVVIVFSNSLTLLLLCILLALKLKYK